jgi:hypothetical protein
MKCGYAINQALDIERARRALEHIDDEASWREWYATTSAAFDRGELASRCGADACLIVLHRNGRLYAYCVEHFAADSGIVNGNALVLRTEEFCGELVEQLHLIAPFFRPGFPEDRPLVADFVHACFTWQAEGYRCT